MPWQRKAGAPYVVVTDAAWWSVILTRFPFLQYLAPGLAGEVLDLTTFCAAGPEFVPPITMGDVAWLGIHDWDGRPHSLLGVVRAIGLQETFALYCENPDLATASWHTYDTDPICVPRGGEVWASVMYWGPYDLPASTSLMRCTLVSGLNQRMYWGLADPGMVVGTSSDDYPGIYKTGMGGTNMNVGAYTQFDMSSWLAAHPNSRPFLVAQGGNPPTPDYVFCAKVEYYAPGSASYDPGEVYEDPDVVLPTGTGSTVDQLEVKLDLLQQLLHRTAGNMFNLDPTTMSGVGQQVDGDLLDAVGLLVLIVDKPATRSFWSTDPDRYPQMARLTIGNADGWWPSIDLEHTETVVLPLPAGATRFSVSCEPPMRASVTLYRPTT